MRRILIPLAVFALILWGAAGGCRIIDYQDADGRRLKIVSVGNDTSIDELTLPTANGAATIKGANSQSKLASAVADMAAVARKASGGGVRP